MDVTAATQGTDFVTWINTYGSLVAFFAQLVYWLAMVVLLAYAVAQYKRWVNFTLGTGKSGKLRLGEAAGATTEATDDAKAAVSVEDFVE